MSKHSPENSVWDLRRLGLRGRIFVISLALTMAAGTVAALVLGPDLNRWLEGRVEEELVRVAAGFAGMPVWTQEQSAATAQTLSKRIDMRVTIVDSKGLVLGDSLQKAALPSIRDLSDRPEIVEALSNGRGSIRRLSKLTSEDMVFAAVRLRSGQQVQGALRLGLKSSQLGAAIGDLWTVLLVAGLLGLLAATVLTFLASDLYSRTFRSAIARLRSDVIEGQVQSKLLEDIDLGPLAESVQSLAVELRQSWVHLERQHERLEAVLEGMDDAVIAVDIEGVIQLHNSAARRLVGVDSDLSGRKFIEVVRAPRLHELLESASGGRALSDNLELPGPPSRSILARCTSTRDGVVVVVMQDTTRMRELEKMRRDFVANVSHELRTPISVIRANAETLADGAMDDPAFAQSFLDGVIRNADRMSRLISDLLDLARVESGRLKMERRRLSLSSAVISGVDTLRQTAKRDEIALDIEISDDFEVYGDPKAIEQVVVNLVHNALKHSAPQSRISLTSSIQEEFVWVAIEDQGMGVPEALRSRIFERFFRVDKGRARSEGGTGLGLAIARHLVEAMGGSIGVADARDGSGGAQFWFTLPRFQSVFVAVEDEQDAQMLQDEMTRLREWRPADLTEYSAPIGADTPEVDHTQLLRRRMLLMAGKVEEMIAHAVRAVERRDLNLAQATIIADRRVNRDEVEMDELCMSLLRESDLSPQDFRFVTRASKMVTDLERIADLAVNISERAALLNNLPTLRHAEDIPGIAALVQVMVRDVIDAFVNHDGLQAQRVIISDDQVDGLYHSVSRQLVSHMSEHPDHVEAGMHLQAVVKFLERIGDHATNLAEQVIFMVEGHEIRHAGKMSGTNRSSAEPDLKLESNNAQDPS